MPSTDSRKVGESESRADNSPETAKTPVNPPAGEDPTTRQSDKPKKEKPHARLAAPLVLLAFVAVVAGGVLAVHEWGWWGLAAAGVCLVAVVAAVGWSSRRAVKRRRSTSRRTTSRTGGAGRSAGSGGRRGTGTAGRRGIMGRLTGRQGGTAGRGRGGVLSRLAGRSGAGTRGRGGLGRSGSRTGGSSRGRGGARRGSVLGRGGRGPKLGRGGSLLSTGTGSGHGRSRRGKLFAGKRGNSRRTPGIAKRRRRGGHMLTAPSMPSLGKTLKKADKGIGKAAGGAYFKAADAVTDAVDTVKPHHNTSHGDTDVKSEFEKLAETIPSSADRDPVTQHDIGIIAVITGLEHGYEYIAQYVDKYRERISHENYAGTEPLTIETLDAVARATRACAPVIAEAMNVLKLSPSWQDLENRMDNPNAARSDVALAKQMGLL